MYLFIFGCAGSLLLHRLPLVAVSTGYSLVTVCGLLIAVASPVAEHESSGPWASVIAARGLSSCGSWALEHKTHLPMVLANMIFLLHGTWDPLQPWIGPTFLTRRILDH